MTNKITVVYLDKKVEISTERLLHITFEAKGKKYRVQPEVGEDELNISVDTQLIVYPRASNMVWLKAQDW